MAKTLQIRDVDDATYDALSRRASREGITVPELVRRELHRVASQPSALEWLETVQRPVINSHADPGAALDELRGEWPDGRR